MKVKYYTDSKILLKSILKTLERIDRKLGEKLVIPTRNKIKTKLAIEEYRKQGFTYQKIGEFLGITRQRVYQILKEPDDIILTK